MKTLLSFKILGNPHSRTQHHIWEDLNLQQYHCQNLKFCIPSHYSWQISWNCSRNYQRVDSLRHNYSDCWAAYERYMHFTLNHSVMIVDESAGTHGSMMEGLMLKYHYCVIEGSWRCIKTAVFSYNWMAEYVLCPGNCTVRQKCKAENIHPFCKFIEMIVSIKWNNAWRRKWYWGTVKSG
jgi:hypothetical protein